MHVQLGTGMVHSGAAEAMKGLGHGMGASKVGENRMSQVSNSAEQPVRSKHGHFPVMMG